LPNRLRSPAASMVGVISRSSTRTAFLDRTAF
jgi:hypothetical protein